MACVNKLVFQFKLLTLHLFEAFLLHMSIESGYCTCLCLLSLRLPRRFGCESQTVTRCKGDILSYKEELWKKVLVDVV